MSQSCDFVSKAAKAGDLHSDSAEGSKSETEKKNSRFLWQLDKMHAKTKTKLKNISLPPLGSQVLAKCSLFPCFL